MKAHKSKYFAQVLQTCTFFKYHTKRWDRELSEGIKLMGVDQLYMNIIHNQFETTLTKQILCFLISKLPNDKFLKDRQGGSLHYLAGRDQEASRKQIINMYYVQIALEQYCHLADTELPESEDYTNIFNFCQLNVDLRFKVLSKLVSQVWNHYPSKKNIQEEEKQSKLNQSVDQGKKTSPLTKIQQCMILGQDNMNVYIFVPFMPEYLFTVCMGKWGMLNKPETFARLQKLIKGQRNTNSLHLCESIYTVYSKFMNDETRIEPVIRYHKVKSNMVNERKQRVSHLKKHLFDINQRYCIYLRNYDNRCWAYYPQRQHYIKLLEKSQDHKSLLEAFKQFILLARSKVYRCKVQDESSIPANQCNLSYEIVNRDNCRINCREMRIGSFKSSFSVDQLFERIIDGDHVDSYVLLQVSVISLEKSMKILQFKAANYFKKVQKRMQQSQKQSEANQESQVQQKKVEVVQKNGRLLRKRPQRISDSLSSLPKKLNMQLRPKSKRTKKFGIRTIDSDESEESQNEEDQNQTKTKIESKNFNDYEYKKQSVRIK